LFQKKKEGMLSLIRQEKSIGVFSPSPYLKKKGKEKNVVIHDKEKGSSPSLPSSPQSKPGRRGKERRKKRTFLPLLKNHTQGGGERKKKTTSLSSPSGIGKEKEKREKKNPLLLQGSLEERGRGIVTISLLFPLLFFKTWGGGGRKREEGNVFSF